MKKSYALICSAGSIEDIQGMINEYFYSSSYYLEENGEEFKVRNSNKILEGCRVILKRGRYRFERETK